MKLKVKSAQSIKNLALLETENFALNVALINSDKSLGQDRDIDVRFLVNVIEQAFESDLTETVSYATLNKSETYPDNTTLGEIADGTVKPTFNYHYDAFLNFCGTVIKVEKIPPMTIDEYTKEIQIGYFITIATEEFTLIVEYSPVQCFDGFLGKQDGVYYVPSVGDIIKGKAEVTGFLI